MNTPNDRLKFFIISRFGSLRAFAKAVEMIPSDVSKYTTGKIGIGKKMRKRLIEFGINEQWLDYGTGEMLTGSPEPKAHFVMPSIESLSVDDMRKIMQWYKDNYEKIEKIIQMIDK